LLQEITVLLRDRGLKVTPQRLAIYEALASTHAHPSAEMLFQRLQPIHPTMSLATVYKTIEMLKTVGIVNAINVGEDSFRYELATNSHPHLICTACRRVEDLHWIEFSDYQGMLREKLNFTLHKQQFYFYGICEYCKPSDAR
jgi:Fur family transcriptional regulator, peroxide stress response regulator